jgi:hypothetical protein
LIFGATNYTTKIGNRSPSSPSHMHVCLC